MKARRKKIKFRSDFWIDTVIYIILALISIVTLYPFLNVLALSFNDAIDSVAGGIYIFPRKFTTANYITVLKYPNLSIAFSNSVLRTVIGTIIGVFFTSTTAFVLSRKDFVAKKAMTLMFAITMYVSGGLIPSYLLMKNLHLFNNFLVYIIPGMVWTFSIFLMRSYIDGLSFSLQESAIIDGANDIQIYAKIILPVCMPSLATIALFYAVGHWNSWFDAYLYTSRTPSLTLLQFELQKIITDTAAASGKNLTNEQLSQLATKVTPKSIQMAITIIVITPIIMVYPFLQKYFIKGMTLGAVKG